MSAHAPTRQPASELTPRQRAALQARGLERRKVTPKALLARVAVVIDAYRAIAKTRRADMAAGLDLDVILVGALEDLASAAYSWSRYVRDRHEGRWPEPEDVQPEDAA